MRAGTDENSDFELEVNREVDYLDNIKARKLEEVLKGQKILSYTIRELLNNGKSAAVFKGIAPNGDYVAVKIFDNELIERFGHEIQEKRIQQEISLIGHNIPNLIKILGGGKNNVGGDEYYYIVMDFVEGENLKQYIESKVSDFAFLQKVTKTLYYVSEALLEKGIVHRDIKPENIMVSKIGELVLMDLGVLKLIGVKSFSDQEERQFVGTLRYAAPEFLLREEKDTIDGWRAVNLYQIGGVLHDLIMNVELFIEQTPYPKLVLAIKEEAPRVSNKTFPFFCLQLTRDLLVKDWKVRLELCGSERLENYFSLDPASLTSIEKEVELISSLATDHVAKFEEIEKIKRTNKEKAEKKIEIAHKLVSLVRESLDRVIKTGILDSILNQSRFFFETDTPLLKIKAIGNTLLSIKTDISKGFLPDFYLLIRLENDESGFARIAFLCMFASPVGFNPIENPSAFFNRIITNGEAITYTSQNQTYLRMHEAFSGNIEFDLQTEEAITLELLKLIRVAIEGVAEEVSTLLERRKAYALKGEESMLPPVYDAKIFSLVP